MSNYQTMAQRINTADTLEALNKVEASLDRIFNNGIFTVNEYSKLDSKIVDKQVAIEVNRITQTQQKDTTR
jgi:ribosomal protein S20